MRVFANAEIKDSFHMIHFQYSETFFHFFDGAIQVDYFYGSVSNLKIYDIMPVANSILKIKKEAHIYSTT